MRELLPPYCPSSRCGCVRTAYRYMGSGVSLCISARGCIGRRDGDCGMCFVYCRGGQKRFGKCLGIKR